MKFSTSIKKNHEFRRLYAKGKNASNALLALYCRRTGRRDNRLGITVTTKVGKAVVRNKLRRRLKEIYRLNEDRLHRGLDLVVVARVRGKTASYWDLERAYLSLCAKLGMLRPEEPDKR